MAEHVDTNIFASMVAEIRVAKSVEDVHQRPSWDK
jgi:hypothetical protein